MIRWYSRILGMTVMIGIHRQAAIPFSHIIYTPTFGRGCCRSTCLMSVDATNSINSPATDAGLGTRRLTISIHGTKRQVTICLCPIISA